jgi:hypothetical protein
MQIKLVGCHRQTDATIIHLVQSCPLLIELDLGRIAQLTDATLQGIWLNSVHLRELRMNGNDTITEAGFLDLEDIPENIAYGKLSIGGIPVRSSHHLDIAEAGSGSAVRAES